MVMFKAKFEPVVARAQQQQQPQPQPQPQPTAPAVPPIEEERGPQAPVKLPGQPHEPERVAA